MTAVERVGRSAIRGAEAAGTLTLLLWGVLLTLPRVLPIVGKRPRWRAAVAAGRFGSTVNSDTD